MRPAPLSTVACPLMKLLPEMLRMAPLVPMPVVLLSVIASLVVMPLVNSRAALAPIDVPPVFPPSAPPLLIRTVPALMVKPPVPAKVLATLKLSAPVPFFVIVGLPEPVVTSASLKVITPVPAASKVMALPVVTAVATPGLSKIRVVPVSA